MFRFASPEYFYLLLLVPVVMGVYFYNRYRRRRILVRFAEEPMQAVLIPEASQLKVLYKYIILCLAIVCLVGALARPQFGSKLKEVNKEGIEIMLAVDVSNSMLAQDFEPSRLERTKFAIDQLMQSLREDRIGLVIFAGDAYMQLPITSDYRTARNFARNISPSMVSMQGTAIGKAIDLAASGFSEGSEGSRVIILISDGENHEDDAIEAARRAAQNGIKIYVIGIGTPEGSPISIGGDYIRDENGEMVVSRLDETTLEDIALSTNGAYIRATARSIGLEEIVAKINETDKRELTAMVFEDFNEQYQYPLLAAFILLIIEFLIIERRNRILAKFNIFNRRR